jgi:hypothetical protein
MKLEKLIAQELVANASMPGKNNRLFAVPAPVIEEIVNQTLAALEQKLMSRPEEDAKVFEKVFDEDWDTCEACSEHVRYDEDGVLCAGDDSLTFCKDCLADMSKNESQGQ